VSRSTLGVADVFYIWMDLYILFARGPEFLQIS
jgi:hypothetical protein